MRRADGRAFVIDAAGSAEIASLWPTKAGKVAGIPDSSGSARPASVSETSTTLMGSAYVPSIGAPRCVPSVPTP